MDLPIKLNFYRKIELYYVLKDFNKRRCDSKAWSGEKDILKWASSEHHHLGSPINTVHVRENILKDQKYDNFPDDANKPMENLITRGFATGTPDELFFSKDGLLMADVIFDIDDGKGWRYGFWYYLIWVLVICGAVIAIGSAINIILSPLLGWLIGSDS